MLDTFAYPVSALMMLLHDLLSLWLVPDTGLTWVLSTVVLVCVVRLVLLRPAWVQLRAARRTALLQPQLAALKRRHSKDPQGYLTAARELRRSEGSSVASGLLPLLLQLPVFLGLYHLLAGFTAWGALGSNGIFSAEQVQSFAEATVFGVPLSAAIRTPAALLQTLQPGLGTAQVVAVVLPLLLVAALATFLNGWRQHRRSRAVATPAPDATRETDNPLADSMRQVTGLMVWLAPLGLLLGGILFPLPLAMAVYWAVNGTWTTLQTQLMNARLDRRYPAI
ncbi:MAG: membrane protein insertase YidC [Propionibacteriaceae bacterium]